MMNKSEQTKQLYPVLYPPGICHCLCIPEQQTWPWVALVNKAKTTGSFFSASLRDTKPKCLLSLWWCTQNVIRSKQLLFASLTLWVNLFTLWTSHPVSNFKKWTGILNFHFYFNKTNSITSVQSNSTITWI